MSIADGTARVRRVVEGSNGNKSKNRDAVRGVAGIEDAGSIDAVRDLLFGRQFQEMDARLASLEQRMLTEVGHLQSNVSKRLDLVEEHMKREVREIEGRLEAEKSDRKAAQANTTGSISQINSSIDGLKTEQSRLNQVVADTSEQLAAEISKVFKEYQSDMFSKNKELSRELESTRAHLLSIIENKTEDLRSVSVKKSILGEMLVELGMRIQPDGTLPSAEEQPGDN